MHPSVLRIFSGQFCPQTVVSVSLFHLHDHVCRIHHCGSLTLFILFRIIHGVSFGMVTVGGNTVVIDIMPSSRRGEGWDITDFQQHSHGSGADVRIVPARCRYELYHHILLLAGFLHCRVHLASLVKLPYKPPVDANRFLDRFILLKGIPAGISLLLLIHSLWNDHQLCSHVCQTNRYQCHYRLFLLSWRWAWLSRASFPAGLWTEEK